MLNRECYIDWQQTAVDDIRQMNPLTFLVGLFS